MSEQVAVGSTAAAAPAPGSTHTAPVSEEPLGALVHRLSEQLPELVRSEIRLGQAELAQKGKAAGIGIGLFGGAGVLGLYGLGALIATAIIALDLALPLWLSALIVTVVLFALAAVAALVGKKEVAQATPPAPEKAIAGVKQDVAVVKGRPAVSGKTPEELQAEIVEQREALSATVHELGSRLDVKKQVKDRATTDAGKPRPELIAGAALVVAAVVGLVVWRIRR